MRSGPDTVVADQAPAGRPLAALLRLRRPRPSTYLQAAALAAIMALGAAVRVDGIAHNPPGFFTDEASFGYNAYSILKSGRDEYGTWFPLLFRSFGEYKLPVFIYSEIPFIAALGLTETAVRLTSVAYGTLTILATFLLARALFRHPAAAFAAALALAIMPWHIHFSRTGLGDIITFPLFLTLSLYVFLLGVRRPNLWLLAGVLFGLTFYTYRAAWVTLPPLLVVLGVIYVRDIRAAERQAFIMLCIILVALFPIGLHFATHQGDRSGDVSLFNQGLGFAGTVRELARHYVSYFSPSFLVDSADNSRITRHYLPGFGDLYYIQLPFLLAGLGGLLLRRSKENMTVLALLLLFPLSGALTPDSPISSRTILGSVVFALLTGYGVLLVLEGLRRLRRPDRQVAIAMLAVAVTAIAANNFASYLRHYHDDYPKLSAGFWGWQFGPRQIIADFKARQDSYDELVMDQTFNAPEMFFRFYAPDDCTKCVVGSVNRYDPQKRQLFALRPEDMPAGPTYLTRDVIRYPDGTPAFYLVEIRP